jgi:4-hydroxybenzoate polyprenyltransferase
MNTINAYTKIIRPVNVIIVILTQLIIYHFVVNNNIANTALNFINQILLALATSLVAAGGYVINDVFDYQTDRINKPSKTYIDSTISLINAKKYYYSITFLGFVLSLYLAIVTDNLRLLFIYPLGVGLLYYYAKSIKKNGGLIANIVVSLFIFFVCALIIIAERKSLFTLENYRYLILITSFGIFALFVNLVREIVKDMEDIEGDRILGTKSLPNVLGINNAKFVCYFNIAIIISISLIFTRMYQHDKLTFAYNLIMIQVPLIFSMIRLYKSKDKNDFHIVSNLFKLIMILGLIYLILLSYVEQY